MMFHHETVDATMTRLPLWTSLRQRISVGYAAIAVLILLASALTFGELRVLEARVSLGDRMSDIFDGAMEIRRFERNYFLHRQEADYAENLRYVKAVRDLLQRNQADFRSLESPGRIDLLRAALDRYEQAMAGYVAAGGDGAAEERVRASGKALVAIADDLATGERRAVQSSLASFRTLLVVSIGGLVVVIVLLGQGLARRVVLPLRALQEGADAVSRGERQNLTTPSRDRELVSVVDAFNHMLRELEVRQRHLVRAEKLASLGTMLSGVAHELNNPLSNISLSCQILLEELGSLEAAAQKAYLAQIDGQTERARRIVRSLLDFARDREFAKAPVSLRELVAQTVGFIRGEVPARVAIAIDVPEDIVLVADKQRLQQAFLNLLRNAVEALDGAGRVSVTARRHRVAAAEDGPLAAAGCQLQGEVVDVVVADDGPGIPPKVLPRIFDPFFTTKDVGRGMGLGLFIVYEVIEEHDGCIAATSEPGEGAAFHVRLPLATENKE
jgi:two-component system NtrC family sensor kinase